jgi:hypothetical protein
VGSNDASAEAVVTSATELRKLVRLRSRQCAEARVCSATASAHGDDVAAYVSRNEAAAGVLVATDRLAAAVHALFYHWPDIATALLGRSLLERSRLDGDALPEDKGVIDQCPQNGTTFLTAVNTSRDGNDDFDVLSPEVVQRQRLSCLRAASNDLGLSLPSFATRNGDCSDIPTSSTIPSATVSSAASKPLLAVYATIALLVHLDVLLAGKWRLL